MEIKRAAAARAQQLVRKDDKKRIKVEIKVVLLEALRQRQLLIQIRPRVVKQVWEMELRLLLPNKLKMGQPMKVVAAAKEEVEAVAKERHLMFPLLLAALEE